VIERTGFNRASQAVHAGSIPAIRSNDLARFLQNGFAGSFAMHLGWSRA